MRGARIVFGGRASDPSQRNDAVTFEDNGRTDALRPSRGPQPRAAREICGVETRADLHRIEIFFVT